MKNYSIVLCGVGGQGTVLASKVLAAAAMANELPVMSAETIGMAQRGGSVFSHLRIGDGIYSPMIAEGTADLIIGFEPGETVRMLPYLKEGGCVVSAVSAVMPVTASLGNSDYSGENMISFLKEKCENLTLVDAEKICMELGNFKVLNMVLLGAAINTGALPFTIDDIKEQLKKRLPEKLWELNFKALESSKER